MSCRTIHGVLLSFVLSLTADADKLALNPSDPEQHRVARSEALLDLSTMFLKEPWRWPEFRRNNLEIRNPHLIYPGELIALSSVDGKARRSLQRAGNDSGRLSPRIREESLEQAIPLIPVDAIKPFLAPSRVVSRNEIESAPYIVALAGEHLIGGAGQNIYVKPQNNLNEASGYRVFRSKHGFYKDPETNEILGYEATYIGDTKLLRGGDPATFQLTKTRDFTSIGDRLLPVLKEKIRLNYQPRWPETQLAGHIISVLDGVSQIGQYNVVAIDRGLEDGLETGHVLEIYQSGDRIRKIVRNYGASRKSVKLPDERAGILLVFRPFRRVSYALVMKATGPIHVLDLVKTP